ncbi:Protein SRG1 [Linum grandiflorum]
MGSGSVATPVQELAIAGQEPSERYNYRGNDAGSLNASVPLIEIPVIDVGRLISSCPSAESDQLAKLSFALSTWGCFQIVNHGMTSSFVDRVHEISEDFFRMPKEEKHKYSRESDSVEGYGTDMILAENQTLDWIDRLYLTLSPPNQVQLRFWPQKPPSFRETLEEYGKKIGELNEILLKAMAKSLNLEEKCFLDQYGRAEEAVMKARFNLYPPCPRPDQIIGVKPHADGSALTFLLQDKQVGGLQFLKGSEWFRVPIIPHALLVNVGDQVEIMSNGVFKSPVHRVVTNSEKERYSLAVFCVPSSEKEIKPAEGLISETRPALYKKVKDYVSIYFEYYQRGRRPIEAAMI